MPPATYEFLQQTLERIIETLEGHASLPDWLKIPSHYCKGIMLVLRAWRRSNHMYSPKVIQQEVTTSYSDDVKNGWLPTLDKVGSRSANSKLQIELSIYRRTMALFPSLDFAERYEPQVAAAMSQFATLDSTQGRDVLKLREYIAQTWQVNPTWYADDWEQYGSHIDTVKPTVENIPNDFFCFLNAVQAPNKATCFYNYMKELFTTTAGALGKLKKSMTLTFSVGEIITKLETARHLSNTTEWTTTHGFDRISLSNTPDHARLSMLSHLYAQPLLKKHHAACVTMFTALCPALQTAKNIDVTSTALATQEDLWRGLGVEHMGYLPERLDLMSKAGMKGIYWYNTWKSLQSNNRPVGQLLCKDSLVTWLYGLFFKLVWPSNRHAQDEDSRDLPIRMHSPLNLSTFFRLLNHLAEMGYPGHSLNQILNSILTGRVATSARPAVSQVLTAVEVTAWNTNVKQSFCTAPFSAEMSTLAATFTRVLPFAIIADDEVVPPLRSIRKCTVQLPHLPYAENCHFLALVFTSFGFKQPAGGWGSDSLRGVLLNQEYITKHKDDVIVITCWRYDASSKAGSFWLREDVAKRIDPGRWMCEVYNTYTWKPLYEDRAWRTYLRMQIGEAWID